MSSSDDLDLSEYCLVDTIQRNLAMLLDRILVDKHIQTSVQRRECRINVDTRYQLGKIRSEINDLEKVRNFNQ